MTALIFLIPVALVALMIRSQRQKVYAQRSLLSSLTPGEEVLTSGGLIGVVVSVRDREATVELAPGMVVRVALAAIIGRPAAADPVPAPPDVPEQPTNPEGPA